jgi:hypothetical protein
MGEDLFEVTADLDLWRDHGLLYPARAGYTFPAVLQNSAGNTRKY